MDMFGEGYPWKLGGYGYPSYQKPTSKYGYPSSRYGYYPSVSRLSSVYFLLDKLIAGEDNEEAKDLLKELKGILKHWTGQPYPYPKTYPYPKSKEESENEGRVEMANGGYPVPSKDRMDQINFLLDKLIKGEDNDDAKNMLQEVKALVSRIAGGDTPYPKVYPYPKGKGEGFTETNQILESVTVDWVEEDKEKPFKFIGKALKVDGKTKNNRFYARTVVEPALEEAKNPKDGNRLTVMAGHPKSDETNPLKVIGKMEFGEIGDDDWVPYEAELANTTDGKNLQELLRGDFVGDVSIRARGKTAMKDLNGEQVENVESLQLKGLDVVIEGAIPGAGVDNILNSKGGEFNMGTTLEELKKERPDLVEAVRSEEKDKLNKKIQDLEKDLNKAKEELEEAKDGSEDGKVKDLEKKVSDLETQIKIRESQDLFQRKLKDSGLPAEFAEGLEKQCLGKSEEDMGKLIDERIELVKKVGQAESVGLSEREEEPSDEEKQKQKEKDEQEVKSAFNE